VEAGFHPTGMEEVETEHMRELKARRAEHYLRGPIRIADIHAAAKLGPSYALLLLAIHHRGTVTGQSTMTLPSGYLADFGIDRNAKARGLKMLERAKLITVKRIAGHSAVVQLTTRKRKRRASSVLSHA
jgi:hypothetical protein